MKLNPIIPQRKKLQDQLWDFVQPNSTHQIDLELENQAYIYYNECCYNLPIEAYTTPSLHLLCLLVKERLHSLTLFVGKRTSARYRKCHIPS